MPIAINTSRPPSATTVPVGAAGGGAPRTTTTSRRGGRTRSRSPPVMGGRMASETLQPPPPGAGENPSSAAAAAAAAAKAFSGGSGVRQPASWPEGDRSRGDDPGYRGYEKQPYPGSNWPAEEGSRGSYSTSRYQSGGGGGGGYGGGEYQQGGSHYRTSEGGRRPAGYPDRASSSSRGHHYDGERGQHRGSQQQHRGHYPPDYRYNNHGRGDSRGNPKGQRVGNTGTSLVIGGATPIHVPKTTEGSPHVASRLQRGGSAASVFRGRPGETSRPSAGPGEVDDDSPQQILLSLRTPTTSFEEKTSERPKKSGTLPLSPEDPPQIQNSHHQQRSQDQLFEPHRNSEGNKQTGSFETAPSFSLFNQSFDSFGDGHYFNVDASLQDDSFGMGRTASAEQEGTTTQILQSASAGNFSQQLLASGSGALTLGYSPVNSFGNVSAVAAPGARRTNMMVVGGPDPLTNSPTQVLGMYRSYSGGGGGVRSGPLDDSHLRMSVGSFGAQSMAYTRSYGEPGGSPSYYYSGPNRSQETSAERSPPFYSFLRRYRAAFKDCTFLLPGLKAALLEMNESGESNFPSQIAIETSPVGSSVFGDPSSQDTAVARRRVESSVFAFGGNPSYHRVARENVSDKKSIFRGTDPVKEESATVTPNSNSSPPGNRFKSRARSNYEEELPGRYYENESRLSWEFEENPPIEIIPDEDMDSDKADNHQSSSKNDYEDGDGEDGGKFEGDDSSMKQSGEGNMDSSGKRMSSSTPQPKMRYRCKLCGQPKQNHTCPYQQSLARSIGVMIFPAVNAFTAAEPGTIAPALSDMNNFVDSQKEMNLNETSPSRPTPDRVRRLATGGTATSTTQVTPESMRSGARQLHSPSSFATNAVDTPSRRNVVGPARRPQSGRKRSYAHLSGSDDQCDLLFIESMELKPEQFRLVSPSKILKAPGAFSYPALPLPYAQRKRLSDNLFSLSNEVPKLTDECAQVLREAREKDMWDLAVAELMTQVVVIIHCPEGDNRFEGLRQYLLTLGIAC